MSSPADDEDEDGSVDLKTPHLNWAGPGGNPAHPGPGPASRPPCPPSLPPGSPPPSPAALLSLGDDTGKPPPLANEAMTDRKVDGSPKECVAVSVGGLTSVLDILEGRRPLGEPVSPPGGPRSQENGGQQGEDSGIESMDTLSEKSPNQGESPFHTAMGEAESSSRVPTYSSSMGPVVVALSGKMSPPVSDSGSSDSVTTPPDTSPPTTTTTALVLSTTSAVSASVLTESGSRAVLSLPDSCPSPPPLPVPQHEVFSPPQQPTRTETTHSDAQIDPPGFRTVALESRAQEVDSEKENKVAICDSIGYQSTDEAAGRSGAREADSGIANEKSLSSKQETATTLLEPVDISAFPPPSTLLENKSPGGAQLESQEVKSDAADESQLASADLVRSCDGADKSPLDDPLDSVVASGYGEADQQQVTGAGTANKNMHAYATSPQTANYSYSSNLSSFSLNSNNLTVSSSSTPSSTSTVALADRQLQPLLVVAASSCAVTLPVAASIKSTLLSKRPQPGSTGSSLVLVAGGSGTGDDSCPPNLVSVNQVQEDPSQGLKLPVSIVTTTHALPCTVIGGPLSLIAAVSQSTTNVTHTVASIVTTLTGPVGGTLVRSGLPIRPGSKMVPVKLVTVPGAGNVRMLRVSPVKGGEIMTASTTSGGATSFLPPRTVVLNSSLIKAISCVAATSITSSPATTGVGEASVEAAGTTSLVRYPVPVVITTTSTSTAATPAASICDKTSVADGPLSSSSTPPPPIASQLLCPVIRASIASPPPTAQSDLLLLPPPRLDQEVEDRLRPVPSSSSSPSPEVATTNVSLPSLESVVMETKPEEVPPTAPSLPSSPCSLSSSPSPGPGNHVADDTLVDAITDGDADDDYEDGVSMPCLSSSQHSETEQHNGIVSPPPPMGTSAASEVPAGLDGKRKGLLAAWRTNGKKLSNDDSSSLDGTVEQDGGGGSLLRPLLGSTGGQNTSEEAAAALPPDSVQQPPSVIAGAKRRRRDTGSSVHSDRSDLSSPTSGEQLSSLKRARLEEVTGAKPVVVRNSMAGLKESNVSSRKGDSDKKELQQMVKVNKVHDNG